MQGSHFSPTRPSKSSTQIRQSDLSLTLTSAWRLEPAPAWLASRPRTLWMWCVDACRQPAWLAPPTQQSWGPCVRSWSRKASGVDYTKAWAWTGWKGPSRWELASPHLTLRTTSCWSCTRWATLSTESAGSQRAATDRNHRRDEHKERELSPSLGCVTSLCSVQDHPTAHSCVPQSRCRRRKQADSRSVLKEPHSHKLGLTQSDLQLCKREHTRT